MQPSDKPSTPYTTNQNDSHPPLYEKLSRESEGLNAQRNKSGSIKNFNQPPQISTPMLTTWPKAQDPRNSTDALGTQPTSTINTLETIQTLDQDQDKARGNVITLRPLHSHTQQKNQPSEIPVVSNTNTTSTTEENSQFQLIFGESYYLGQTVEQNFAAALDSFMKAANLNNAQAQCYLGVMYENGQGVEQNLKIAADWYNKAADQGLASAQFNLGKMFANGKGVEKNLTTALQWYTKAANLNLVQAQYCLGCMYEEGQGVEQDLKCAADWYRKAAEQNYPQAQLDLGWMYDKGLGVAIDLETAAAWYRKAADQDLAQAQFNLGVMHEHGFGVVIDLETAADWYRKAADQNYAKAQVNLGKMCWQGLGVQQDMEAALQYYTKAAEQNYPKAQFNLGKMFADGDGVKKNLTTAVMWITKAADQNHKDAQLALTSLYAGEDLAKNLDQATYWLLRHGLSEDQRTVTLQLKNYFSLIERIPSILTTYDLFKNVNSVEICDLPNNVGGKLGGFFTDLITSKINLTRLKALCYSLNEAEASLITELISNSGITEVDFNYAKPNNKTSILKKIKKIGSKKLPIIFGTDTSSKSQLLAAAHKNKDLPELRAYLNSYLEKMQEAPVRFFDVLNSDVVKILADRFIVTNLKNGYNKKFTQAALDEFLLSLQRNSLKEEVEKEKLTNS